MIYSRWGSKLTIKSNCGTHNNVPEMYGPLRLVEVIYEDGKTSYFFLEFLKADKGMHEIENAFNDAPEKLLNNQELEEAFRQAM